MTLPYGVDISSHQYSADGRQKVNFAMLNPLIKFCGVRAGISWGYTDRWYAYSKANLTVPRMDYHVIYPGEDANRQMDHFLRITNPQEHDRLVLDLELDHGYSKYRITQTVNACLQRLHTEAGRYPVIYSRAYWVNEHLNVADMPPNLDWWIAHYLTQLPAPAYTPEKNPPPFLPNGVNTWLIHQTGDRANGAAHGVASHYIDTNRWNGTEDDIKAYFGVKEESHEVYLPIVTVPEPEPVEDDWTGLLKVKLWSQKDIRWGNDRMGSSGVLMKHQGCLVTNVANYLDYLGVDTDPERYNNLLGLKGGYQYNYAGGIKYANMYWKYPGVLFPQIQRELTDYTWYWNGEGWQTQARNILKSKRPVLGLVDFYAGGELNQHWVLIVGERSDGWWAVDPETGTLINLSKYGNKVYRVVAYRRK